MSGMANATKDRTRQTVRDLLISMAVVGLFVAFLYLIVWRPTPDPVKVVDVAGPASVAASAQAFPVVVPVGLPDGWRATSARFTPGDDPQTGTWFNGYVDPDGQFVAVVQQDYDLDDFIAEQTDEGSEEGTTVVNGRTWTQYLSADTSERSLVNQTGEVVTVVTGTVDYEALAAFAARLRPV
jgi:hypothetical protein